MSGRPLLPAPSDAAEPSSNRGSGQEGKQKRVLIKNACAACRRRKSKCDGVRPVCSRCQALRTECVFESEQDEGRWALLRRRCRTLEIERDNLRELVELLRSETEQRAVQILQRIRATTHEQLSQILQEFRDGNVVTRRLSTASSHTSSERLPGIHALLGNIDMDPSRSSDARLSSDGDSESSRAISVAEG